MLQHLGAEHPDPHWGFAPERYWETSSTLPLLGVSLSKRSTAPGRYCRAEEYGCRHYFTTKAEREKTLLAFVQPN